MRVFVGALLAPLCLVAPCAGQDSIPDAWRAAIAARRARVSSALVSEEEDEGEPRLAILLRTQEPRDELRVWTTPERCDETLASIREIVPVRSVGEAPNVVTIGLGRIAHGDTVLHAFDGDLCGPGYEADDLRSMWSSHEVLSLVGPLVSMHEREAGYDSMSYFHDDEWSTIDLRTGAEVSLAEQVDGAPLGIAPDRFLVQEMCPSELTSLASVADLEERLARFRITLRGSAIVHWDPERGLATWRVYGITYWVHGDPIVVSLDLVAAPRPWLRPYLDAAREGRGHLLERGAISSNGP